MDAIERINMVSRKSFITAAGVATCALAGGAVALAGATQSTLASEGLPTVSAATPVAEPTPAAPTIGRMTPRAGADYPRISEAGLTLASLDEDLGGFEPLLVAEDGGMRVVTPFYSVFVPSNMFPSGWTWGFSGWWHEWGEGSSCWLGHNLTIVPDVAEEGDRIHAYVTSSNWTGIQGEMTGVVAGEVAWDPFDHVVISDYFDASADPYALVAQESLAGYLELVSCEIVAARNADGAWVVANAEPYQPRMTISTPYFTVDAEPSTWPDGIAWRWVNHQVTPVQNPLSAAAYYEASHFLNLAVGGELVPSQQVFLFFGDDEDIARALGKGWAFRNLGPLACDPLVSVIAAVKTDEALGQARAADQDARLDHLAAAVTIIG